MILTPRETDVLRLLLTARRTTDCAAELGITLGTWKVYTSRVYQKHGVRGRLELLERAKAETVKEPLPVTYVGINGTLTVHPDGRTERS